MNLVTNSLPLALNLPSFGHQFPSVAKLYRVPPLCRGEEEGGTHMLSHLSNGMRFPNFNSLYNPLKKKPNFFPRNYKMFLTLYTGLSLRVSQPHTFVTPKVPQHLFLSLMESLKIYLFIFYFYPHGLIVLNFSLYVSLSLNLSSQQSLYVFFFLSLSISISLSIRLSLSLSLNISFSH